MSLARFAPHYRRIEQALRDRIVALRPGDALPSDAELMAEFGVSRMTARHAMQRLVDEGLLVRQPGRGSFVAEPPSHRRADRLLTFSREMERRGRVPSSRILERRVRPATASESTALGLAAGDQVLVLRRVRLGDDQPVAVETAVLDSRVAPAVVAADLEHGSLHETLARAGHPMRRGSATIAAERATAEDARLLGIRAGDPLLVERRVIHDAAGRRIEATESRYPGDRYALDVRFDVEGAEAAATPAGAGDRR